MPEVVASLLAPAEMKKWFICYLLVVVSSLTKHFSSHKQTNKRTKKKQPLIAHALDIKGFAPSSCHLITAIQQPWEL